MNRLCHGVIDMANGQVVLVTTEGLSGGSPTRTVYYVAEEDPTKARRARQRSALGNKPAQAGRFAVFRAMPKFFSLPNYTEKNRAT